MQFPPAIFREYDIRGNAKRDLTDELARNLGGAIAALAAGRNPEVVVAQDCRLSSPRIAAALIEGLVRAGAKVTDIGVGPSPMLYFASRQQKPDAAVMVTGSHNPKQDNGFKMLLGDQPIFGDTVKSLQDLTNDGVDPVNGGGVAGRDILSDYTDALVAKLQFGSRKVATVVDCGNGAAGEALTTAFAKANLNGTTYLYSEMDGNFPNHHPDPTKPENLADLQLAMKSEGAELGLALDGDGDRVGVVDRRGRILWGDMLTLLFARDILRDHPGRAVIGEVKCSRLLFEGIAAAGGRPVMAKVGHALIKKQIKADNAILAGEMSGHLFFCDRFYGFDDGIYSALRMIELLSRSEKTLEEIIDDMPTTFVSPEIRIPCDDEKKFDIVQRVKHQLTGDSSLQSAIDIDGIRAEFSDGWILLRASNTQPALIVRAEGDSEGALERLQAILSRTLAQVGITWNPK